MPTEAKKLNLSATPDRVELPESHYVFVERTGPFMTNAPQAWQELHGLIPGIAQQADITGYMSLYKVEPQIYRAGVTVGAKPASLPAGLVHERLEGGRYARFVLKGSYANLPEASGQAFGTVESSGIRLRDDFCIENYLNDPRSTPESELVTEILFPVA